MNYKNIYINLVNKSKQKTKIIEKILIDKKIHDKSLINQSRYIKNYLINNEGYKAIECHHILPKADNGQNTLDNIVFFTPREHIIAHHILFKAYPTKEHFLAWHFSIFTAKNKNEKILLTGKQYEELRIKNADIAKNRIISKETRDKLSRTSGGKNNAMYGKHWYTNGKINILEIDDLNLPIGFYKGRLNVVLKEKAYSTKGYHWYNDGIKQTTIKNGDNIPNGFIKGMLKKRKI